ncbi:MAG: hypothetical protein HY223_00170 [Thaumarchaeota archaeon]|nr:hypothetical protein [Nitrososphaerota archaeon]
MKSNTKILSILLIIILFGSSIQTSFLNLQLNSHGNNIQQASAQTAPATSTGINKIGSYVMFGFNGIRLETKSIIKSGDVGAQNATAEVHLERSTMMTNHSSALVGDTVTIEKSAVVNDVYYNTLANSGTIQGSKVTPLALPVVNELPTFPQFVAGSTAVNVPSGTLVLNSGSYGDITVGDSATLKLTGGIYNINSLKIGKNSNILFDATSQLNVATVVNGDTGDTIGPSSSASIDARGITFFVGSDVNTGTSTKINANIYSPNGDIRIGQNSNATGAFIGNTVRAESKSIITLDSVFGVVTIPKITWIPASLSVQAKPFGQAQLNFTANASATNVKVIVSSQISNLVTPTSTIIDKINSIGLNNIVVTTSIPPGTTTGWHNGTLSLSLNGNTLQNLFNMNIFVPTIDTRVVQTTSGNFTYIATPSLSPFFTNTYDVSTFFTFSNGTSVPVRTYYDVFTSQSTTTSVSYAESTSPTQSLFVSAFNYLESLANNFSLMNNQEVSAQTSSAATSATCTKYAFTYHFTPTSNIENDLSVATNALNVDAQHPLIVRNDISWNVIDQGKVVNGAWQHSAWNDAAIDSYFNAIPPGKLAYVILGTHSPPSGIASEFLPQFQGAANQFVQHTVNYIISKGYINKVAYWQVDNEPNMHALVNLELTQHGLAFVADWPTMASALNLWVSTVKSLDPNRQIIINMYQASPNDIIPPRLQDLGIIFTLEPLRDLLTSNPVTGTNLMNNVGIIGFDIYPDQWADPQESNPITNGFSEALSQTGSQLTLATTDNFAGRWAVPEMAGGPKAVPSLTTISTISASDVSNMINLAVGASLNGAPPALVGLFQLTAPNVPFFLISVPPYTDMYGLITTTTSSSQINTDFLNAEKSSIIQNCPQPTGQLTVIKNIINTGGGTLTLSGVTLKINGTTVTNGTANTFNAGKYIVSENSISGYAGTISGDCASDGTVILNEGDVKTCIITNTFALPTFFENFDSTLSGWSLYSAFTACCGPPLLDQVTSAFGFPPPSSPNWGEVHAIANGVQCLFNNFVDFQKSFTVNTPGHYNVSATIGAAVCDVCIVDGRVDVDHAPVLEHGGGTISGGTSSTIAFESAVINIPSAGTHVLDLRMDTSEMCSGNFASYFDNVSVQPTSSPVTGTPVGGPYFNMTLDQQSANVTRPDSVTVPLDVNWYQGWNAQPVSILFGNLTNTNISAQVTSIQNTTSYQEFNITFNVPTTVVAGNYTVPITVWQTGTDDAIATPFSLHVK